MRSLVFMCVTVAASFAFAGAVDPIVVKGANYDNHNCQIQVAVVPDTDVDGATLDGFTRIDFKGVTMDNSSLTDFIVIGKDGKLKDGPGLCFDAETMGKKAGVVTKMDKLADGSKRYTITCGGKLSHIDMWLELVLTSSNEIKSLQEISKVQAPNIGGFVFNKKTTDIISCSNMNLFQVKN